MKSGKVRITRGNERYGSVRKLNVLIDGRKVGTIGNKETREFDIDPGEHTIQVSMDWVRSRLLDVPIAEGQVINFRVTLPPGGAFSHLLESFLTPGQFYELERIRT
jgi:hypothetical protein